MEKTLKEYQLDALETLVLSTNDNMLISKVYDATVKARKNRIINIK